MIRCIKFSSNRQYLVGFEDIKYRNKEGFCLEKLKIWKLDKSLKFIHEEILDLEDEKSIKEDPYKLIFISENGS